MRGKKLYNLAQLKSDEMYSNTVNISHSRKKELYADYLILIRKSAYKGNPNAQFELGLQYEKIIYLSMENPNYNPKKCFYWYQKAVDQNNPEACLNLSNYYGEGLVTKKSKSREINLLLKSFKLGNMQACSNIALFYKQQNDYNNAIVWFRKSIQCFEKDGDAYFELAKLYYEGLGVKQSFKNAYLLFAEGISKGNLTEFNREESLFYIGKMYFYGQYLEKSLGKAKYLFAIANPDNDHEDIINFMNANQNKLRPIKKIKVDL